ncbi:hypothetical protein MLOOGBEN_21160 [Bacillus sp. EB106-08-02-XG196]|nr:hypothetical protein [Bacillus sp. EB106-08-02-XG196]
MLTALPSAYNDIKTATRKRRTGIVLKRLTYPLFSFTFHLLLYVAITVQAVGMAMTVKITAILSFIIKMSPYNGLFAKSSIT